MEETELKPGEFWAVRDRHGKISLYTKCKPYKLNGCWGNKYEEPVTIWWNDDKNILPEVQWKNNEPTKVKLVIL